VDPRREEVIPDADSEGPRSARTHGAAGQQGPAGQGDPEGSPDGDPHPEPFPAYERADPHADPHSDEGAWCEAGRAARARVPLTQTARPPVTCAATSGSANHVSTGPCSPW
jgi:hypothetical protein